MKEELLKRLGLSADEDTIISCSRDGNRIDFALYTNETNFNTSDTHITSIIVDGSWITLNGAYWDCGN